MAVIIVAIGLVLLLVGGDVLGLRPRIAYKQPIIGKVAGKNITLPSFQQQYEALQHNFPQQYGRMPREAEKNSLRNQTHKCNSPWWKFSIQEILTRGQ